MTNPSTCYAVLLALVLGVGCGGSKEKVTPKTQAKVDATPKAEPKGDATPKAEAKKPEPPKATPNKLIDDPIVEAAIRKSLKKPTGELTKADLEKVKELWLNNNLLTDVKGLEKLTQLKTLNLRSNQLTDVKGLEKLTKLKRLDLDDNPDLTKAQIAELQKALPKCKIYHAFE